MIAVLERSLPFEGTCGLVARIGLERWEVARQWWLVLRQPVLERWRAAGNFPVASARFLTFDSLVRLYGPEHEFDRLVRRVIGSDFHRRWGLRV